MKLKPLASNMTEVTTETATILFSYETPVAPCIKGDGYYRTDKKWSQTTTRHINKWLDGISGAVRPQSFFDSLV